MENFNPIIFSLLIVFVAVGLFALQRLNSRLKKFHKATWDSLGQPVVFLNSGAVQTTKMLRFLWSKNYEILDDKITRSLCRFLRIYLFCYILFFVIILVVVLSTGHHR